MAPDGGGDRDRPGARRHRPRLVHGSGGAFRPSPRNARGDGPPHRGADSRNRRLLLCIRCTARSRQRPGAERPKPTPCLAAQPGRGARASRPPIDLPGAARGCSGMELVAAAHAGWRGTAAGVVRQVVRALVRLAARVLRTSSPRSAPASVPAATRWATSYATPSAHRRRLLPTGPNGRPHLDVRAANAPPASLDEGSRRKPSTTWADCTHCHPELYHSYRREGQGQWAHDQLRRPAQGLGPLATRGCSRGGAPRFKERKLPSSPHEDPP